MTFMLWMDGKAAGPFSRQQILDLLGKGTITMKSLCTQNGPRLENWHSLEEEPEIWARIETVEPKPEPKPADESHEFVSAMLAPGSKGSNPVHRVAMDSEPPRSGWTSTLRVLGVVLIIGSLVGPCIATEMEPGARGNDSPWWLGVAAGASCLLMAFVVDVLTDIRWYLKNLHDRR